MTCPRQTQKRMVSRMAQLGPALQALGLDGEISPLGRWARVRGEHGTVYVAEAGFGAGYYSWCDTPQERTALPYLDPIEAIQAALQRARREVPAEEACVDERLTEPAERVAHLALEPMPSP